MTLKIIVIKDDKPVDQIVMRQAMLTIGRRSECDIPIKDPAVSGNHAEIEYVGNGYILRDAGSTNGVHVAGRQIKEKALKDGDLITIGEHQLRVSIDKAGAPPVKAAAKPEATPAPAANAAPVAKEADATQVQSKPAPPRTPSRNDGYLKYVEGGDPGQVVKLEEALVTIGEPGIQVAAVSKRPQGHFIIHVDGGKDRNKTPVVNGEAIGFKSRKLEVGDLIEVADLQFEYCFD